MAAKHPNDFMELNKLTGEYTGCGYTPQRISKNNMPAMEIIFETLKKKVVEIPANSPCF